MRKLTEHTVLELLKENVGGKQQPNADSFNAARAERNALEFHAKLRDRVRLRASNGSRTTPRRMSDLEMLTPS